MKLYAATSLLLFAAAGFAKSGGQSIRIFILPSQSAEANEKLRIPYRTLITSPASKADSNLEKSLGKLVGDIYSSGFRKIELPKCTLYLHKDARNLERLGSLLDLLRAAAKQNESGIPSIEFKDLPDEVRSAMANVLGVGTDAIKGSARCALEPEANFSYEFMGQNRPMGFPWSSFDSKLKLKMRNARDDAFVKPEFATESEAPKRAPNGVNQSGFELLLEPGVGGQMESDAIEKTVKYLNDKYAALESEYNSIESRLKDRLAQSTFGRGLSSDNFRLKDLEDISKKERNHGQGLEMLFHDPSMSAAESESMRNAQFQGLSLCVSLWAMRSEHNGSNAVVHLTNPFIRP